MPRESLARRAGGILLWPVGTAFVFAWVHSTDLRRVPSLARLTRRADFGQLQSAAAAWTDHSFELAEGSAPWLDRAGRQVLDRCDTGLNTRPFSFPPDPPCVTCCRDVTVVYGFDGSLPGRLVELAAALGAVGWGDSSDNGTVPLRDLDQRKRPVQQVNWSPVEGFGLPAGLEAMPPERRFPLTGWLYMAIDWASRGESRLLARQCGWPGDPRPGTATYQPVEIAGTGVDRLAGQALERHEHAITIRIQVSYYLNANVNARPGRLRKRLLPVRNRPPGR
jgi:hypothetical protein